MNGNEPQSDQPAVCGESRKGEPDEKPVISPDQPAKADSNFFPAPSLWNWLFGILLVAAIVLAYQPVWRAGYIWDDNEYVTNNPLLTLPDGLRLIWFSLDSPSQYFPLVYTVFRFEHLFWGFDPAGYHWVNILLHAVNALLVWRVLKQMSVPGAWLAAAIFALHPVQVESVAWITELKNVLSLFFFLLSLLMWLKFIEVEPKPCWRFYAFSLIFYILALFSKTTACTQPAALLLILWLAHKPVNVARWLQIVPFVILGLGMGLLSIWWEHHHQGTQGKQFSFSLLDRILIASRAVWFYTGKLLWPVNLTFSYPRWTINPANPLAYGWLAGGAGIAATVFFARRWLGRSVEVAALFYVATLSPLLGFIMLYTFRYTFVADHYQYVAMIGPTALAAAGITKGLGLLEKRGSILKMGVCGMLLLVLGILTWRQCQMYKDPETLWRATIARNPASWMAHNNLGLLFQQRGEWDKAVIQYQEAVAIDPDSFEAQGNLGYLLLEKDRWQEAIVHFRRALAIHLFSRTEMGLGLALQHQGQFEEAITHDEAALKLEPNNAAFLDDVAWFRATCPEARFRNGKEAIQLAERACKLTNYQLPLLVGTLAAAYAEAGRFGDAVATAEKAHNLALSLGRQKLATKDQELLRLFKNHQPYREKTGQSN